MKISAVGVVVWRPILSHCTDRLSSLFEQARSWLDIKPFSKSIVGKLIKGITFEVGGAYAGGTVGKALLGTALREMGRDRFPVFVSFELPIAAFAATYALGAKSNRIALAALGLGLIASSISLSFSSKELSESGAAWGFAIGSWGGYYIGTLLGGYAGLRAANSAMVLWDPLTLNKSYAVGMSKQFMAEAIFEAIIKESALPYLRVPINLGRSCVNTSIKLLAYNSNTITALKYLFREKKFSSMALFPLMIKTACERYNQKNSIPITNKLIYHITKPFNIVPAAKKIFKSILKLPFCFEPLKAAIQSISKKSDKLAVIFMRSLHQYMILCKNSEMIQNAHKKHTLNPSALEIALASAIEKAPLLAFGLSKFDSHFKSLAKSLLLSIQQGEQALIGYPFANGSDSINEMLSTHLKYFFIYTITHIDTTAISPAEEKNFAIDVADLIFFLYSDGIWAKGVHKMVHATTSSFFGLKQWVYPLFEQPDEKAVILIQPEVILEYDQEFLGPEERAVLSGGEPQLLDGYL